MKFYLLDAGAPGLVLGLMIVFMLITVTLEAITMIIMKYNGAGKSFLDSLLINLVSMGAGFVILFTGTGLFEIADSEVMSIFILFLLTVLVEFLVLYLLNRKLPVKKTLTVAVVINVVSYALFYLLRFIF